MVARNADVLNAADGARRRDFLSTLEGRRGLVCRSRALGAANGRAGALEALGVEALGVVAFGGSAGGGAVILRPYLSRSPARGVLSLSHDLVLAHAADG